MPAADKLSRAPRLGQMCCVTFATAWSVEVAFQAWCRCALSPSMHAFTISIHPLDSALHGHSQGAPLLPSCRPCQAASQRRCMPSKCARPTTPTMRPSSCRRHFTITWQQPHAAHPPSRPVNLHSHTPFQGRLSNLSQHKGISLTPTPFMRRGAAAAPMQEMHGHSC
jgi:hypothetical protein